MSTRGSFRMPGRLAGSWRLSGPSPDVFPDLGALARVVGERPLVTADPGIVAAGIAGRTMDALRETGRNPRLFSDFGENPTESQVAAGAEAARSSDADCLIGVGGGSSLDMAKGIGFLLAGAGRMEDYRGYGRCEKPLPPLYGVPTTAGTGSEAQSYALISRDSDHAKLACGSEDAMFRAIVLDPETLRSAPAPVIAAAGFDAVAHAVETAVTKSRSPASFALSVAAFAHLARSFRGLVAGSASPEQRRDMQLGAFLAGAAIERSMLGAAHATANPLTRRYGVVHGRALAITLPRVIRWNAADGYADLLQAAGIEPGEAPAERLAELLEEWITAAGLPRHLERGGDELEDLAEEAAGEWTGQHNPLPFTREAALDIYRACA